MENKKKKLIEASVSSNKKYFEGTLTVSVKRTFRHPIYGKTINASKKYIVEHPKKTELEIGSKVWICSCAPISKRKRFIIMKGGEITC